MWPEDIPNYLEKTYYEMLLRLRFAVDSWVGLGFFSSTEATVWGRMRKRRLNLCGGA